LWTRNSQSTRGGSARNGSVGDVGLVRILP
jgi:hypothetical protein